MPNLSKAFSTDLFFFKKILFFLRGWIQFLYFECSFFIWQHNLLYLCQYLSCWQLLCQLVPFLLSLDSFFSLNVVSLCGGLHYLLILHGRHTLLHRHACKLHDVLPTGFCLINLILWLKLLKFTFFHVLLPYLIQ